jgi:hypothetical protein
VAKTRAQPARRGRGRSSLGYLTLLSMIVGSLVLLQQHQTSDDHEGRIVARQ